MAHVSPEFIVALALGVPSLVVAILTWLESRHKIHNGQVPDLEQGHQRALYFSKVEILSQSINGAYVAGIGHDSADQTFPEPIYGFPRAYMVNSAYV